MSAPSGEPDNPFAGVPTQASILPGGFGRWVFGAFGVFCAWGLLVPLDAAVIANGTLMSAGRNQSVQHLTGGVIRAIHAREGALVAKGDALLELEPLVDLARLSRLKARQAALSAVETRLRAEKEMDAGGGALPETRLAYARLELRTSDTALARVQSDVSPTLGLTLAREQEREFLRGRRAVLAQVEALERRAAAERERRAGLGEQIERAKGLLDILDQRVSNMRSLAEKGYVSRSQLWDGEGRVLEQRSQLARLSSEASALDQTVAEIASEIARVRETDARDNSQRLTDVLSELESNRHEIAAAEQALGQTRILAPTAGHLVHFAANTPGAVVRGGETLAEIVPSGTRLVARGRVTPEDVVAVHLGQRAEVHVTALPSRISDPIDADVTFVASDATQDQRTGERYFEIETQLDLADRPELVGLLSPGLSAQIFVKGAPRTFARYLGQPLVDALRHTFRER